jgi:hypothetical protein
MSAVAAGRAREGGLTAELLQRQDGPEKRGDRPERFGLSFRLALARTDLLQQGWDRHFCFAESVETLPPVVIVTGVVRRLVVVGVVQADGHVEHVETLARL